MSSNARSSHSNSSRQYSFTHEDLPVWVPASTSLALTLCLHELATNAAKYGALSNGTGQVRVAWELAAPGTARLVWRESGRTLGGDSGTHRVWHAAHRVSFNGGSEPCIEFPPEGLVCTLELGL